MRCTARLLGLEAALLSVALATAAAGPAVPAAITVRTIAEVQGRVGESGGEAAKLLPAERLSPGDEIIYTLEIRNTGALAVRAFALPYAIPEHVRLVANTAVAPGADVSYSVDGGRTFAWADDLMVEGPKGVPRPAKAADYTHILWRLKHGLKAHAVAFAHFRAIVK